MICETVVGKITLSFQLDITIQYLNAYEMHMLDKEFIPHHYTLTCTPLHDG